MRKPRFGAALLVPLLATLGIGTAALGFSVHRSVEANLLAAIDEELTRVAFSRTGGRGPDRPGEPPPAGSDDGSVDDNAALTPVEFVVRPNGTVVGGSDRNEVTGEVSAWLVDSDDPISVDADQVGRPDRYRVVNIALEDGGTFVAGLSLATVDASLASLGRSLVVGGVVLVAIQGLVAAALARAVTRPVARLSAVAHRIAGGDLEADVGPATGPRETAELTTDLGTMLARLRTTIAERERSADEALQARADMERFMADISHELRTPLTALRGYADLYQAGALDEEDVDRAMRRIGDESVRLNGLVDDLLQLMRPPDQLRVEPVDLAAVASAVVDDLRAAHPDHVISSELEPDRPSVVAGDAARLHQAILNVGANSCHHTPAGTAIRFEVRREGEHAIVQIVDHGPGIEPAEVEQLFQPFARADASRNRRSHDGAGLGLALVSRIVAEHRGRVDVTETAGGGVTFTLRFPIEAAAVSGQGG